MRRLLNILLAVVVLAAPAAVVDPGGWRGSPGRPARPRAPRPLLLPQRGRGLRPQPRDVPVGRPCLRERPGARPSRQGGPPRGTRRARGGPARVALGRPVERRSGAPDAYYRVILRAPVANLIARGTTVVALTVPDAGRLVLSRPTVYPAATASRTVSWSPTCERASRRTTGCTALLRRPADAADGQVRRRGRRRGQGAGPHEHEVHARMSRGRPATPRVGRSSPGPTRCGSGSPTRPATRARSDAR